MTELQFRIALIGRRFNQEQRKVLYRVMVLGEPRTALIDADAGITQQWLSNAVKSLKKNYAEQLEKHGLIPVNVVVKPDKEDFLRLLEGQDLDSQFVKGLPEFEYPGNQSHDNG